jgi:Domain of unknown function (DUF1931)
MRRDQQELARAGGALTVINFSAAEKVGKSDSRKDVGGQSLTRSNEAGSNRRTRTAMPAPTHKDLKAMIAALQSNKVASHIMSVAKFERFFRIAVPCAMSTSRRYSDFIKQKVCALRLSGGAAAKRNGRAIVEPVDLPISIGMQENIRAFKAIDEHS